MPPPAAVVVIAIVGTFAVALVFKHLVIDPYLSQGRRRRRPVDVQQSDDEPDSVPTQERERSSRISRPDNAGISSSLETTGSRPAHGLLSRSTLRNLLQGENSSVSSIELENLVARDLGERRNSSGQNLRHRTVSSSQDSYDDDGHHPLELEEDINRFLPYVPLLPRQTHVVGNSGSVSPATPTLDNISNALPSPPLSTTPTGMHMMPSLPQTTAASPLMGPASLSGSITGSQDPLWRRSLMQSQPGEIQVSSNVTLAGSPSPLIGLSRDSSIPLPQNTTSLYISSPTSGPSVALSQEQEQNLPSPFLLHATSIPSLSQSYPQELEIEHGVELISPPSSRPDSPFSMANISPRPPVLAHQNPDRVLRHPNFPTSSGIPPSEVEMGLGNESFDTLSPAVGPKQLALREAGVYGSGRHPVSFPASGSLESAGEAHLHDASTPLSGTSSLKSSTYLSFSGSEAGNGEDDDDDNVSLAARRDSLILAVSGLANSPRNTSASESLGHGQGLGLTLVPPSPGNTPAPLSPSLLSPRSRLAEVSTSGYGVHAKHPLAPLSDTSELSDLDLMSDYDAPSEAGELVSYPGSVNGSEVSESGRGGTTNYPSRTESSDRESDASWSVAGGSDFGGIEGRQSPQPRTPQLRPVGELKRDVTIRGRKKP